MDAGTDLGTELHARRQRSPTLSRVVRGAWGGALVATLFFGTACPVNSSEDCRQVCEWWQKYCTGETLESCLSDCRDTTESASEAVARCVRGEGWGVPSSCRSASCCVRFVYDETYYRTTCG